MTEERDPEVSRRYRQLGSEEPPRALDERILARARRRRGVRWYGPLAAAAILVLVVAVTVQVERQPSQEASLPTAPPASKTEPSLAAEPQARDSARQEAADAGARERKQIEEQVVPEARAMRRSAPIAGSAAGANEPPETWLERIAELRRQGREQEADDSLKQFRERYPGYSIPEETRTRVERKVEKK